MPEIAADVGVHCSTIHRAIKRRELRAFQIGGRGHAVRVYEPDYVRWLRGRQ